MTKCTRCGENNPAEIHTCTPLALRLAAELDTFPPRSCAEAATELRRLHALNAELVGALEQVMLWIENWSPEFSYDPDWPFDRDAALAALAKAKEQT